MTPNKRQSSPQLSQELDHTKSNPAITIKYPDPAVSLDTVYLVFQETYEDWAGATYISYASLIQEEAEAFCEKMCKKIVADNANNRVHKYTYEKILPHQDYHDADYTIHEISIKVREDFDVNDDDKYTEKEFDEYLDNQVHTIQYHVKPVPLNEAEDILISTHGD